MVQLFLFSLQHVNLQFKYNKKQLNLVHHQKLKIHASMVEFLRDLKSVISKKVNLILLAITLKLLKFNTTFATHLEIFFGVSCLLSCSLHLTVSLLVVKIT